MSVDKTVDAADPKTYDALLLPGGVMNPDKLRVDEDAMKLVKAFLASGKPVAAVCHGPWLLVQADALSRDDFDRAERQQAVRTTLDLPVQP